VATGISQDHTIDYQHFIDYQLTRAQGRMKSVEVGTAVVRLLTAVLVYVLFAVILDHTLVLASGVRLTLLLVALAAALGYIGWAVVRPSWRRISHFYAARTIEQATPEFKNSLMNFLDLRRHADDLPVGVLAVLEERAVSDLSHVQVEEKVNQDRLVQASYGLAAVVLVTCAAVLFNAFVTQRSLAASLGRVLFPTADIQPPTQTRLTEIKPGDKSVVAHTTVTVSAVADGRAPAQVSLYWSDDGKFWREQPLHKPESASQFDPWGAQLLVEKPIKYYLVGGDCRTKEFTIDVTDPPMVTSLEVTYDYPDYTGWPKYTTNNGNIDALEGTTVSLTATTNRPVASGQLRFGSSKGAGPAMQSVARRDDQLSAQFSVTKNDSYVIWFVTADGETNPRPTSYEIKVRVDLPPTVSVKPGIDQVDPPVPANAIIPIGVVARDDFGIDEIKLNIGQGQDTIHSIDLTDAQVAGKELSLTHRLDLERLRLNNGDEITYWVDVADNRQPKRNRVSSPHYRIRLGSPLSPTERDEEEKRQVQLARAEDAERAAQDAQKLEDPAQQTGDPNQNPTPNPDGAPDEPAPKDERALDVIRKYLQEKDRREQLEQPRDGADKEDENRPPSATDSGESGEQGDPSRGKKQDAAQGKKNESDRGESASQAGDKPDKDGQGSEGQEKDESGRPNDATKRNQQPGGKKGNSSANDQNSGEKPPPDKSNSGKESDQAGSKSSASGGAKKGDKNNESTGDRSENGDADGDKGGGDKQAGDKESGDKPGGKSGGDKAAGDDASGAKPKGDGAEDASGKSQKSDGEAGDRSNGKPDSKGEAAKKSDGAGQEATKPRGETLDSGTGSDNAQDSKTQGKTTGSKGQPGSKADGSDKKEGNPGDKSDGNDAEQGKGGGKKSDMPNGAGQKPNGEKPNGQDGKGDAGTKDESGGDKAGGDKAGGDKAGGDKAGGDKAGGDKAGGDKAGGDKAGGDKAGGDKAGGDKAGGDKAGGDKAGGDKAGGDKAGGDKAGGDKAGGDKAGGDKAGGDKAGGDKAGGDKAGGDKAGGDKAGGDKAGGDKAGGDKAGGDKAGGDKAGGDKAGGDKAGGDKAGGDKGGGDKGGGDKSDGDSKGNSGANDPKGGGQDSAGSSGNAQPGGKGAPTGQGAGSNGGGSNSSGERTENAQPGGGENPGQGPIRKNDAASGETPPTRKASTPDYSDEGSELVLDRLAKQLDKGDIDPQLLKRLGWTREELEQFVKEFQGPGATDANQPGTPGKSATPKKKTDDAKTTLDEKKIRSTRRGPGQTAQDAIGENYEGRRSKPAPEYEDHVRAYNMSQSKGESSNQATPKRD
jgi:collagen type III alpha